MKPAESQMKKIWFPQLKIRRSEEKVSSFESREEYVRMRGSLQKAFRQANHDVERKRKEVAKAHAETVSVRNM